MKSLTRDPAFIELLKDATKAPSGHNTQPWKFHIEGSQIIIKPDYTRRLPVVDPDDHALFISLGCALENLILSAKAHHFSPSVTMDFSDGKDEIVVDLTPSDTVKKDELYDFIPQRQSTRKEYDPTPVEQSVLEELKAQAENGTVEIVFFTSKAEIQKLEPLIIEGSNRQFHNKEFVYELLSWVRFNEKAARKNADGLSAASTGSPNVPAPIGRMYLKQFTTAKSEARRWQNLISNSAGFALFTAKGNSKSDWVKVGRSFQRFGLKATQLNLKHAHVNMPCEEVAVRTKLTEQFDLCGTHPLLLIRFGYAEAMPYSYRRPVEDVIVN